MTITEFINLLQDIKGENLEIYVYNELNLLVPPKIEFLNKEPLIKYIFIICFIIVYIFNSFKIIYILFHIKKIIYML